MIPRKLFWFISILAIALALGVGFRPDRAIRVVTGLVAHDVCSQAFVSGFDPDAVFTQTVIRPGIRRLRWALTHDVDRTSKVVRVSLAGWEVAARHSMTGWAALFCTGPLNPTFSRPIVPR